MWSEIHPSYSQRWLKAQWDLFLYQLWVINRRAVSEFLSVVTSRSPPLAVTTSITCFLWLFVKYCNISGMSWLISPLQLMPQTICWLVAFGVWTSTCASHCGVNHGEVRMPNSPKLWLRWAILHLPCFAIRRRFHRGCAVPFPPRIARKFTFVSAVHTPDLLQNTQVVLKKHELVFTMVFEISWTWWAHSKNQL